MQTGGGNQIQIDESMRFLGIDITFEDSSKLSFNSYKINHSINCISYI